MRYLRIFEEFEIKRFKKIKRERSLGSKSNASWYPGAGLDKVTSKVEENSTKSLKKSLNKLMRNILRRFELTGSKVKYLNSGSYGMAFIVDHDKVIKITSDKGEAKIAKSLIGRDVPRCVEYYGVIEIFPGKEKLFAILMQKADPLSKEEEDLLQEIDDKFDMLDVEYEEGEEEFEFDKKVLTKIATNHGISIENVEEYCIKLIQIYKSFKEHDIATDDLHTGNMGYVGDDLVHFDIMGNTSFVDLSKISKI